MSERNDMMREITDGAVADKLQVGKDLYKIQGKSISEPCPDCKHKMTDHSRSGCMVGFCECENTGDSFVLPMLVELAALRAELEAEKNRSVPYAVLVNENELLKIALARKEQQVEEAKRLLQPYAKRMLLIRNPDNFEVTRLPEYPEIAAFLQSLEVVGEDDHAKVP